MNGFLAMAIAVSWLSGIFTVAVVLPPLRVVAPFLAFGAVAGALAWQTSRIARGLPVRRGLLYLCLLGCPVVGAMLGALLMTQVPGSMTAQLGPDAELLLAAVCGFAGGFSSERLLAIGGAWLDIRAERAARLFAREGKEGRR